METKFKIIKQINLDRVIYIHYDKNEKVVGLNYHHGCDILDWEYKNGDPILTKIYEIVENNKSIKTEEDKINKTISMYHDAFLFEEEKTVIPDQQCILIKKALDFYVEMSQKFNQVPTETEGYDIFDMQQLSAMMNYEVSIYIREHEKDNFCSNHGMDFPIYNNQ
jgi:hypothetical protein